MNSLPEKFATVVVGAGPAGLLFSLINRISLDQHNINPSVWPLFLLDKRTDYVRNHRLILDKTVFTKIQKQLDSPLFNTFIQFLSDNQFRPVINELEAYLLNALQNFGVDRIYCDVGMSTKQSSLKTVRSILPNAFTQNNQLWTIVGADSVRSSICELLGNDKGRRTGTHEYLIRLKLLGTHLPKSIGVVENFRLSKVLTSILTYRFNKNGFAEMDLFLSPEEYDVINRLNPNPKNPISLTEELLNQLNTPFLQQVILAFLERNTRTCVEQILIQSSFKLEHSINRSRIRYLEELNAYGFLLGDAAIALPFQRGMSAMIKCAYQLSEIHFKLFDQLMQNKEPFDLEKFKNTANLYQEESEKIAKREVRIVSSRASLVRGLRHFTRISAMLPFPIQSWLLGHESVFSTKSIPKVHLFLNFMVALGANLCLISAFLLEIGFGEFWTPSVLIFVSLLLQFFGGIVYRASFTFQRQSHLWIKRIWQFQIMIWMLFGASFILFESFQTGNLRGSFYAILWWIGGMLFVIGLVLFDALGKYWIKRGQLQ
ncbi:hypothetical protein [Aquimarina algiphila]|uniref:hypothetical protein n=1 Tax=Aquimarina algiphila TaxID=2047982 RepID=UPI00232FE5E5|nr:hypothetical protein [Aquimarina algiphila]